MPERKDDPMDFMTLFLMGRDEMRANFPTIRRWLDAGFELEPERISNGIVGLFSPLTGQAFNLNLATGEARLALPTE